MKDNELDQSEIDRLLGGFDEDNTDDALGILNNTSDQTDQGIKKEKNTIPMLRIENDDNGYKEPNWDRIAKNWKLNRKKLKPNILIGQKQYHRKEGSNILWFLE